MAITGEFKKNDLVTVSDGTPKPPKHHTRKLGNWECRNYKGVVWRADDGEVCVYQGEAPRERPALVNVYQRNSSDIQVTCR